MKKQVINLSPTHNYPYSQAIKIGDFIYVSGQTGVKDPRTGEEHLDIEAQCRQCLENLKRVLELAGSSLEDVIKVTVFLRNAGDYDIMNGIYQRYFQSFKPARSTVVTGLAYQNMLVEIEGIACCSAT